MIGLALEAYRLKDTVRAGWVLRGIRDPESVADHSWGTALLCMIYGPSAGIDVGRAVRIAIVHDLAEYSVGDIPARVSAEQRTLSEEAKSAAERDAMQTIAELLAADREALDPGKQDAGSGIQEMWRLYEERESPEALFVRDMNLVDMCIQALLYEGQGAYDPTSGADNFPDFARLDEFFATAGPRISTPVGRRLYDEVHDRYQALLH